MRACSGEHKPRFMAVSCSEFALRFPPFIKLFVYLSSQHVPIMFWVWKESIWILKNPKTLTNL
ncbi:hypothetical protein RU07_02010 [Agrobacterium tumefaciens]|uniref:Uncharacterized protein n=1 Tax=Agrobacterium tumefaciens TaxID=358 RepID=A0A0D0L5H3_AGRTU|nr:hypothetical protein RU07_02010 [Agrobacterium tumefaciens]